MNTASHPRHESIGNTEREHQRLRRREPQQRRVASPGLADADPTDAARRVDTDSEPRDRDGERRERCGEPEHLADGDDVQEEPAGGKTDDLHNADRDVHGRAAEGVIVGRKDLG
jgi:hypothetical protein